MANDIAESSNPTAALAAARQHREQQGWRVLGDFARLLALPNVTGHVDDLKVNASELEAWFEKRGAAMELAEIDGHAPVVIGELRTARPTATLGVYVHYDGQPVAPDEWTTPPFSPTLASAPWHRGGEPIPWPTAGDAIEDDWRIYARSASDDKTPFPALTAALDALDHAGLKRQIDLIFLFEGEEESGSPHLEEYMTKLAPRLGADAWLLCDGPVHQTRRPQVAFGARGFSGFDLTFYGPERELHSGHYGNWVPNPAFELARFLAACKDDQGMVTIDGFYDDTRPITDAEREAIAALPPVEKELEEQLGFGGPELEGSSYPERLMLPSFNVRGLRAAAVGEGARNVIPAEATASVDIRLAAGDDPDRMIDRVEDRLRRSGYTVLDRHPTPEERRAHRRLSKLTRAPGYRAVRIDTGSPLATSLIEACRIAGGEDVVALPTFGGSIPLYLFEDILEAPVAVLPIANHDNNQHSADENVRVANLWYGIDLWATLLTSDLSGIDASGN